MKLIFSILIFLLALMQARSQVVIAGNPSSNYIDISPDTLLNPSTNPFGGNNNLYYYVDLDSDNNDDLVFHAKGVTSSGAINWNVLVSSLNPKTFVALGSIDSSYFAGSQSCNSQWIVRNILKKYELNDTIRDDVTFIQSAYLGYRYNLAVCPLDFYSTQWVDSTDHYIGIRYVTATDTAYGWIKVNCSKVYNVLIKEYSFSGNLNSINQGLSFRDIKIYPNPAKDEIDFDFCVPVDNGTITIYSAMGQAVMTMNVNGTKAIVSTDKLPNGNYFCRLVSNNKMSVKKFVVTK